MKIVTICNYKSNSNIEHLCAWWIDNIIKYSDLDVEIWYEKNLNINAVKEYKHQRIKTVKKERTNIHNILKNCYIDNKASHNIGFKLYNLCNEVDPFIFIDIDAIVLKDISPLLSASKDKQAIMINHQRLEGHTAHIKEEFLNSGVQIISDTAILDFNKIIKYQNQRKNYVVPGYDQALLFNYFKTIDYDYTHENVGPEWNNTPISNIPKRDIGINHYWFEFKPWIINCPLWAQYIKQRTI